MPPIESAEGPWIKAQMNKGEPITHFFYEYQGARAVEPLLLVENAVTLWHEQLFANESDDNGYLWDLAASIVRDREETPMYSWIEWMRFQITTSGFIPSQWKSKKPFPYKGLLISGIYIHEARRLCLEGNADRVWHVIALAYYHLGLNTGFSAKRNTSRAAQMMHAGRTEKVRAMVIGALDMAKHDSSATSMEAAKDLVIEILRKHKDKLAHWLNEFDTLVPEKTKGRTKAKQKNDVFDRIRNLLDEWALPSGPYPEVAEAFSNFNKRKQSRDSQASSNRETSENHPMEDPNYYMRLINWFEDGSTWTLRLSEGDAAS